MSRKAFFAAHCTHRFDQLHWGEPVRKVKYSSVRIENPLSALYRGTEYFSLARTFRTVWGRWN